MNTNIFIQYIRLRYAKIMRDFYDEFIYDDNPNCNSILGPTRNLKVFHSKELFINSNLENIIILAHRYAANISLKWPDSFREKINVLYPVPK